MISIEQVLAVAGRFDVRGEPIAADTFSGGHIHDSFLVAFRTGSVADRNGGVSVDRSEFGPGGPDIGGLSKTSGPAHGRDRQTDNKIVFSSRKTQRYLLQRINSHVFRDPVAVMENIRRVTVHLANRLAERHAGCSDRATDGWGDADIHRRVLRLVPSRDGEPFVRDREGKYWRLYPFIERTRVVLTVTRPEQAEAGGRAFGAFQRLLADLPGPRLAETIPYFHDTPRRFDALEGAVRADPCGRAAGSGAEIGRAMGHRELAGALLALQSSGDAPERVVHNDAKISNVLFDDDSGEAICVTDLDTVMPGLSLFDFGDMMRSMTASGKEDEGGSARLEAEPVLFEALARGYLAEAGDLLTPAERRHLVTSGRVITLENAVRFLTDYIEGDVYFRTADPLQNLRRCRAQLDLYDSFTRNEADLRRLVAGA